jgi:AcrR family transcriptional regulator
MEIKERIIVAADSLFMKYGARSVTMDDIAREISVSKKTIYQYYKDKDEIVTLVSEAHIEQEKKDFNEIFHSSDDAIEEMFRISKCIRKMVTEVNPSLLYDLQKYHRKAWNLYLDYKSEFIKNSVVNNLARGVKEGCYRHSIDVEVIATYRVEQVQMAFDDKIFPRNKFNFSEVQMQLFDHFIHGLLTDKGRKLYKDYQLNNSDQ